VASEYQSTVLGLSVALGIGLLIGAERERRKGMESSRSAAGIRTFSVSALLGAVGVLLGNLELLALVALIVGAGALIAYWRTHDADPGLTTEFALVLTCLLGGLAIQDAVLAAGIGAVLALLLAARNSLHHFVHSVLTEQELRDIIVFSAIALIVLPLSPDRFLGPFDAINPQALAKLVILVMAISAVAYVAMRSLGPRYGLPLAGFASGFVSSTATIYSMGARAANKEAIMGAAVSGAVLSSIATIIQMTIVIALVQPALLGSMAIPLASGGLVAFLYGLIYLIKGNREVEEVQETRTDRAFDMKTAAGFAVLVSLVLIGSAALNAWLGSSGMLLGAAVSGLADAHATAASAASLVAAGKITNNEAIAPILVGLTTNTLMKAAVAFNSGGARYAARIVPGLVMMISAVWIGFWLAG
jgi:uncharacterized membrane protein (DUF4010 family)